MGNRRGALCACVGFGGRGRVGGGGGGGRECDADPFERP